MTSVRNLRKSLAKPKAAWPKLTDFNQVVTLDLKEIKEGNKKAYILWMICGFTRFIRGAVIKTKDGVTTFESLMNNWNWVYGFPSKGFWSDNGGEFINKQMKELGAKYGLHMMTTPPYSPYSNGINERNHGSADITVKKLIAEDKSIDLQTAVNMAA